MSRVAIVIVFIVKAAKNAQRRRIDHQLGLSRRTVSLHYVQPSDMYLIEFALHHLCLYDDDDLCRREEIPNTKNDDDDDEEE